MKRIFVIFDLKLSFRFSSAFSLSPRRYKSSLASLASIYIKIEGEKSSRSMEKYSLKNCFEYVTNHESTVLFYDARTSYHRVRNQSRILSYVIHLFLSQKDGTWMHLCYT